MRTKMVLAIGAAALSFSGLVLGSRAAAAELPLPLEPYEHVVPFRNGCAAIVQPGEDSDAGISRLRWFGGCRFGLVHGRGILQYSSGKSLYFNSYTAHYGRAVSARSRDGTSLYLPRGPGHGDGQLYSAEKALDGELNDKPFKIMAMAVRYEDQRKVDDTLWVYKGTCPQFIPTTLDDALKTVGGRIPLSAAQRTILAPLCQRALQRAKAEGKDSVTAFEQADYSHFYFVYVSHGVAPRHGSKYDLASETLTYPEVQLCPRPELLASCDPIWRAAQRPFIAKREALSAVFDQLTAADKAARDSRFRPLEEALHAKLKTYVRAPKPGRNKGAEQPAKGTKK